MPPSEQWYHDIQQEIVSLRRQVEQLQDRAPVPCVPSQVRLAQTVEKTATTYPTKASGADTFWIVFIDGTFTEAQGNQAATLNKCQPEGSPLYVAHSRGGEYYPEGAYVWVVWLNGRWWILVGGSDHQASWIEFTVNDGAGFATTDASVTVDGITYHDGHTPTVAVTTVYNKAISTNYLFEGDDDDKGIAHYDPDDDKYYIWQMECP